MTLICEHLTLIKRDNSLSKEWRSPYFDGKSCRRHQLSLLFRNIMIAFTRLRQLFPSKLDNRMVRSTSLDADDDATNNLIKQDYFLSVKVVTIALAQNY